MKNSFLILTVVCLCLNSFKANAAPESNPADAKGTPAQSPGTLTANQIAKNLSMITGVAISPLLGVSAVGAYQYYHAQTPEVRAKLSWYSDPWFFVPALLLVGLCFLKDSCGIALPTALKKPFDVLETCEHKISGLVAMGAFVPIVVSTFGAHISTQASLSSLGFATIGSAIYDTLMIPISMAAFFIVFLASNAINILILLSPFTTVDAALKAFRTTILASVAVSAWANPWIGAAWALVVIVFSYFIAGWSFRLSDLGLVFVWEFITRRCNRFIPDKITNKMFLGRKINKVPARSYGKLTRDEKGNLVLNYRPWLVLSERTLTLPEGKYCVGKGAFFSEIDQLEGDGTRIALLLPPRYRGHEDQLVGIYGLADARPIGLRAAWKWLKGMFGFKTQPAPA